MTILVYSAAEGSLQARVLELFIRNPEEDYADGDLALKFQVPAAKMKERLADLIGNSLLTYGKQGDDTARMWRVGPAFAAWVKARQSTVATEPPKAKRGRRPGIQLPELDFDKLVVRTGVPKPPLFRPTKPGESKYDRLFALLTRADQSLELPVAYQKTLAGLVRARTKKGLGTFSLRRTTVDTITLWRDA